MKLRQRGRNSRKEPKPKSGHKISAKHRSLNCVVLPWELNYKYGKLKRLRDRVKEGIPMVDVYKRQAVPRPLSQECIMSIMCRSNRKSRVCCALRFCRICLLYTSKPHQVFGWISTIPAIHTFTKKEERKLKEEKQMLQHKRTLAGILAATMMFSPVSYTHLDVYKRQRIRNIQWNKNTFMQNEQ